MSYVWDDEGRLTSAGGTTYTYDGDGKRVKKGSSTFYWYGITPVPLAETDSAGNTMNEYAFFAGGRIARRDGSGNVYYYFPDHLGSSRSITNASGGICYEADFYPFGGERVITNTCSQNYKFAGMERDSETGNDHTLFRSYASNLGRWLSPDPLAGDVSNPQSLNRYAYVLNSPTNLIDPLGLQNEGPPPHPGCGRDPTIACVWERYHWTIPGMFGAGMVCYVDQVRTPCGVAYSLAQSGAAYPLPPRGEGWQPVSHGAQSGCPGCYTNPNLVDWTWDPDDPGTWLGVTYLSSDNSRGLYAWIPGLAPMANGAMQALKQLAKGVPKATPTPTLEQVPGPAPVIELENPFWKDLFRLMAEWLHGGGAGPLPPSTVMVPIVNPCVFPSFQNTQMCGGRIY